MRSIKAKIDRGEWTGRQGFARFQRLKPFKGAQYGAFQCMMALITPDKKSLEDTSTQMTPHMSPRASPVPFPMGRGKFHPAELERLEVIMNEPGDSAPAQDCTQEIPSNRASPSLSPVVFPAWYDENQETRNGFAVNLHEPLDLDASMESLDSLDNETYLPMFVPTKIVKDPLAPYFLPHGNDLVFPDEMVHRRNYISHPNELKYKTPDNMVEYESHYKTEFPGRLR